MHFDSICKSVCLYVTSFETKLKMNIDYIMKGWKGFERAAKLRKRCLSGMDENNKNNYPKTFRRSCRL